MTRFLCANSMPKYVGKIRFEIPRDCRENCKISGAVFAAPSYDRLMAVWSLSTSRSLNYCHLMSTSCVSLTRKLVLRIQQAIHERLWGVKLYTLTHERASDFSVTRLTCRWTDFAYFDQTVGNQAKHARNKWTIKCYAYYYTCNYTRFN